MPGGTFTVGGGAAGSGCEVTVEQAFLTMFSVIVGALFVLFTGCLLGDQVHNAWTGSTAIDRLKRARDGGGDEPLPPTSAQEARRRFWDGLGEIFGGDPWREGVKLSWLVPTPIAYTNPEELTGFCFRDVPRPRTLEEQESG